MPTKTPATTEEEYLAFLAAQPDVLRPVVQQLLNQIFTCLLQAQSARIDASELCRIAMARAKQTAQQIDEANRIQAERLAIANPGGPIQ